MVYKVLPLTGYKSYRALQAYNALMLGLKMLPSYMGESYEDFFARIEKMPPEDQVKMIKEAALFVNLEKEEVDSIICFCADKNGVPFGPENMKSLGPDEIWGMIVAVATEISKIKIDFVTDSEKKN